MFHVPGGEDSDDVVHEAPEKYNEGNNESNNPDSSSDATNSNVDANIDNIEAVESETKHVLKDILDSAEEGVPLASKPKIPQVVECDAKLIYKSTLVSLLNRNEILSKDQLSRVRGSIHFNNSENYIHASSSTDADPCVDILNVGNDCGVFFGQNSNIGVSSTYC